MPKHCCSAYAYEHKSVGPRLLLFTSQLGAVRSCEQEVSWTGARKLPSFLQGASVVGTSPAVISFGNSCLLGKKRERVKGDRKGVFPRYQTFVPFIPL
ncbi:hypothetical protein TgHK011_008751 [Trichoderma gracile]|nr:hypothetical protein TgHK011_008751 [Trichoderma gracile]